MIVRLRTRPRPSSDMADVESDVDPVTSAVAKLRGVILTSQSSMSANEFKQFCKMTTSMFVDYEKNIMNALEEAYQVCDPEMFDEIRGNIARELATRDWSKNLKKRDLSAREGKVNDSEIVRLQPGRKYKDTKEVS